MDIKGKVVLITGCNRGIGKAMLETFSAQGCNIIACLRQKNEEFDMLCEEIIQRNGTMITKYYFDMMDEDSIKSTITQIFKSKQRIDIMINNAGVVTKGLLQMTTMKQLHEIFQVNFFAHVQFIQGVSKIMMRVTHLQPEPFTRKYPGRKIQCLPGISYQELRRTLRREAITG